MRKRMPPVKKELDPPVEFRDYLRAVRKRWRIILATALVCVGLAAAYTVTAPKVYQASVRLFVSTSGDSNASDLLQGSSFTQQRVLSYADVITSPRVLNPVIAKLKLKITAAALANQITTNVPQGTVLIDVLVDDRSPRQAASVAAAVGRQFTSTVATLETTGSSGSSPVKVSVIASPTVPTSPVQPSRRIDLAAGLILGTLLGASLALLREMLDTRLKSEEDCAQVTDAVVIGGIGFDADAVKRPLIVQSGPHSARAEAFRTLRTNLQFVDAANHPRSVLFTSSVPDEGKTTTTANLAITLAAAGAKVCVLEADLRRPRLLSYMGLEGGVGLTSVLIGQAELDEVLQKFGDTSLSVLGAGPIPPNPSELLGSAAMRKAVSELEERFEFVIIDAPPLLPVTDAAVLSTVADGTVIVIGTGSTTREHLRRSIASLDAVQGRLLGLVLNKIPRKGLESYYYYHQGYAPQSPETAAKTTRRRTARATRKADDVARV